MEKVIAKVQAPAKAILCGQHAVVYGEDAIAFGVELNCHSTVYQGEIGDNQTGRIVIKTQFEGKKFSTAIQALVFQQFQLFGKIQQNQHLASLGISDVELKVQEFKDQLFAKWPQKKGINDLQLNIIYKTVLGMKLLGLKASQISKIITGRQYKIDIFSHVPIGKGLGSSASFNTVLAASLFILSEKPNQKAAKKDYKKIVNEISFVFQKVQHGKPSGIDNFVSVYGGMVLYNKSKSPRFQTIDSSLVAELLQKNLKIGFVDSGVEKNTKLAVSNVFQKYKLHELGEPKYKTIIGQIGKFAAKIVSLLENATSQQKKEKAFKQLFNILELNHQYLRQFDLSNEQIEKIVKKYTKKNQSAVKITGAGMGGVVLIIGKTAYMNQVSESNGQIIVCSMNTQGLCIQLTNFT